jgi:hypothetical protein
MMIEFTTKKIAGLVLLFSAGVAGAVVIAVGGGDEKPATPAGSGDNSGTGTVIGGNDDDGETGAPVAKGVFYISGEVGGLVPGKAASMPVTVTNPNPYPIEVLTLDTGVTTPPGASCPAGSLEVGRYTATGTPVTAPARGTVSVTVPVRLTDSTTQDQSGCAGTAFPLTFTGTARTTS